MSIKSRLCAFSSFAAIAFTGSVAVPVATSQSFGLNAMPTPPGVRIDRAGQTNSSQNVVLPLGKSTIVYLDKPAADIIVSNPSIADVAGKTRRQMIFTGQSVGSTNAFIFDETGKQIVNLEIRVEPELNVLEDALLRHIPDSRINVEALGGTVIMTGNVKNASEALRAEQIAQSVMGVSGVLNFQNMLEIDAGDQVMLQVRIIELQRSSTKQFGININGNGAAGLNGGEGYNYNLGAEISGGNIGFDKIFERWQPIFDRNTGEWVTDELAQQLNMSLSALESVGLARTLAEPNVVAISGKEGDFLVGGEFPIITGVSDSGTPLYDFKSFGIELSFTPTVLSEDRIAIEMSTEVSGIATEGAVSSDGFSVPSLSTKRLTSNIEMASGQTMMIAGLIDNETRQTISEIPGLNRIPILGKLFSSREFINSETELVILATPILVEPNRPDAFITPARGFSSPDDLDRLLLGDLNRHYSPGSNTQNLNHYQAPIGFIDE